MCGQNRLMMYGCQPIHCAFTVSAGEVPPGSPRSGADRSRQKIPYLRSLHLSNTEKPFPSSWGFSLSLHHYECTHPAPNGNQRSERVHPSFVGTTPATTEANTMEHEVIVEGFVLQVEVTRCENIPPVFNGWNSDWDFYGSRELEFKVLSAICYDDDGVRMDVMPHQLPVMAHQYGKQIETALWVEIDAKQRRSRWAA